MGYRTLAAAVRELEASGQLLRIEEPVSAELEVGAIQRRVFQHGGPALLFTRVDDSPFPLLGNLFGTAARTRYLFRDTLATIERLVAAKVDPAGLLRRPGQLPAIVRGASHLLPKRVRSGPILAHTTTLDRLPQLKSWPRDGGAFITLPLVYSESPKRPGVARSNLGMYRVQISGGDYRPNTEVGLHYQLHRGIGVHHAEAIERGEPLKVNIFVGGPPSLTLAAVMPSAERGAVARPGRGATTIGGARHHARVIAGERGLAAPSPHLEQGAQLVPGGTALVDDGVEELGQALRLRGRVEGEDGHRYEHGQKGEHLSRRRQTGEVEQVHPENARRHGADQPEERDHGEADDHARLPAKAVAVEIGDHVEHLFPHLAEQIVGAELRDPEREQVARSGLVGHLLKPVTVGEAQEILVGVADLALEALHGVDRIIAQAADRGDQPVAKDEQGGAVEGPWRKPSCQENS